MSDYIGFDDDNEEGVLTSDESDSIISNLKDELIMESIIEQINNPLNNIYGNTDYIDIFETRYNYLKETYNGSPDFISKLNVVRDEMYEDIFNRIISKYNLSYTDNGFNKVEVASDLYNFFILSNRDNIIDYLKDIILIEKKSIAKSLSSAEYSRKVGVTALKKVLKNRNDAVIISNISHVIDEILQRDIDSLEIIELICKNDIAEASNYRINQYFNEDFVISPNNDFKELYFDTLLHKKMGYSSIINTIKMDLLNLAPRK